MIDVLCVGQLAADIVVRPVEHLDFAGDTQRVQLIELKNGGLLHTDEAATCSVGAGDSFIAGFLAGVLRGWNLERCGRFACAVAALNIENVGATTGAPTYEETLRFIEVETK